MKESNKSLKIFFIVIGVLGLYGILGQLADINQLAPLQIASMVISACFSVFYLYVGIKLYTLLPNKRKLIQNVILVGGLYVVLSSVFTFLFSTKDISADVSSNVMLYTAVAMVVIGVAIYSYLYVQVGRVSDRIEAERGNPNQA